jgi:hypothetical protein
MSILEVYNELVGDILVRRVNAGEISPYIQRQYNLYRNRFPGIDLTTFAARTSNFNVTKSCPGQKAQLRVLSAFDPGITQLPGRGQNSIKLSKSEDGVTHIVESSSKSTIPGVKSFDAIREYDDMFCFFILKTVDLGGCSDNIGGGHQDNVASEIDIMADSVRGKRLTFNGKLAKIFIVVDGRSNIVERYAGYNSANLIVTNCAGFCAQ